MELRALSWGELRDLFMALLFLGALFLGYRRTKAAPAIPPAVTPISQPIEEQVREVKHDILNIKHWGNDHASRLRAMEISVGEVRGALQTLIEGQQRINRHLDMLLSHQMQSEDRK